MANWVMGYRMPDESKAYESHLYRDLGTCKLAFFGTFEEVVKMQCEHSRPKVFNDCIEILAELRDIFEEDFNFDTPHFLTHLGGIDFILGNVDLMKERNVFKFDQFIKIKTDHTECTKDHCRHS